MAVNRKRDPDFVRSIARGLNIIESFDDEHSAMTLSDVARRTGLTRGTAARILHTLEELGYVRTEGRHMALTPRTLRLGYAYLSSQPVWRLATPLLEKAAAELGQPVALSVLDGHDIVYVFATLHTGASPLLRGANAAGIGTRLPAFCTSAGRVLLSGHSDDLLDDYLSRARLEARQPNTITNPKRLREIIVRARETGYATQDQEVELGFRSVAVPVRDVKGDIVAAMNVSAVVGRWSMKDLVRTAVPVLKREAMGLGSISPGIRQKSR